MPNLMVRELQSDSVWKDVVRIPHAFRKDANNQHIVRGAVCKLSVGGRHKFVVVHGSPLKEQAVILIDSKLRTDLKLKKGVAYQFSLRVCTGVVDKWRWMWTASDPLMRVPAQLSLLSFALGVIGLLLGVIGIRKDISDCISYIAKLCFSVTKSAVTLESRTRPSEAMAFLHWFQWGLRSGVTLQWLTILVLILAMIAAWKQARAAAKLTEATERQIQTATEQAKAAKEQVDVARRQMTEALRPILVLANSPEPGQVSGGAELELCVRNDGLGVARDVWWWEYPNPIGEIAGNIPTVGSGIIPPKSDSCFRVRESVVGNGVLVVYDSLAGISSGTRITWNGSAYRVEYLPDITKWASQLLRESRMKPNDLE